MHIHYGRCLDLISDIVFSSAFPEKEIIKEKDVIIDEINSYKDSPGEQIFDDFDSLVYKGHPLGSNILGTPRHLKKFQRNHILQFLERNYVASEMVISSVGKIDFKKLIKLAERYFGHLPAGHRSVPRQRFSGYQAETKLIKRRNHQVHCVIGNEAYSVDNEKKTALVLLNNILGGPGLNSRLNMAVREKHGLCYNIESHYQPYSDTGIFSIYLGTDIEFIDRAVSLVQRELFRLRDRRLGSLQLKRAKQQLQGQVAISFESNVNEMLSIGKSITLYNKIDTLEQINQKIERVNASELLDVANEVLDSVNLSMLMYKPR
jgi:predicted Zn-dependent peptidase